MPKSQTARSRTTPPGRTNRRIPGFATPCRKSQPWEVGNPPSRSNPGEKIVALRFDPQRSAPAACIRIVRSTRPSIRPGGAFQKRLGRKAEARPPGLSIRPGSM